jgi:hypothetical protein
MHGEIPMADAHPAAFVAALLAGKTVRARILFFAFALTLGYENLAAEAWNRLPCHAACPRFVYC